MIIIHTHPPYKRIYISLLILVTYLFFTGYVYLFNNKSIYYDSDKDSISDETELLVGTSPYNFDTDLDGLSDGEELYVYLSNPLLRDTDNDSIYDGAEVHLHLSPLIKNIAQNLHYTTKKGDLSFNFWGSGNFSLFLKVSTPYWDKNIIGVYSPFPFSKATVSCPKSNSLTKKLYYHSYNAWIPLEPIREDSSTYTYQIDSYGFYSFSAYVPPEIETSLDRQSGFEPEKNAFSFVNPNGNLLIEKNGLCFGLVSTAKLLFEDEFPSKERNLIVNYDVTNPQNLFNENFKEFSKPIRYWFWKQFNLAWFFNHFNFFKGDLNDIEAMKRSINDGKTIILGINNLGENRLPNGHALLAYGYNENLLTGDVSFYVYDPNFPLSYSSEAAYPEFKKSLMIDFKFYNAKSKPYYTFDYFPFSKGEYFALPDTSYRWNSSLLLGNLYFSNKSLIKNETIFDKYTKWVYNIGK